MKKTLMLATGALVAASFAGTEAQAVDVELYGQVNKAVLHVDNEETTETSFVDNDRSSSRIGVKGEQQLDNGLTASVLFEFQSENNSSYNVDGVSGDTATNDNTASLVERHSRVGLAGNFGAVFLGHTSGVTDGITEIDMAGAGDVMGSDIDAFAGAVDMGTGVTFAEAYDNLDGGRTNAAVYMTPVVNGFQGGVHVDEVGDVAVALRYAGKMNAYQMKAGIAYETVEAGNITGTVADESLIEDRIMGSATVKHDSGLGASVAYGIHSYEGSRDDATNLYLKAGYTMDMLELAVDYAKSEGVSAEDDELTAYGLAAQYNLGNGVSVGALYRTVELDDADANNENDLDIFLASLRVKF